MNYKQAMQMVKRRGLHGARVDVTRRAWGPGVFVGLRVYLGLERILPCMGVPPVGTLCVHRIWYNLAGYPEKHPWEASECDHQARDWSVYDHNTGKARVHKL